MIGRKMLVVKPNYAQQRHADTNMETRKKILV